MKKRRPIGAGPKVTSLGELWRLSMERRSIITAGSTSQAPGRYPASFVLAMPGTHIHQLLRRGVWAYRKPGTRGKQRLSRTQKRDKHGR